MKKDYIKNLIDDYSARAPLPERETLKEAKHALSARRAVRFYARPRFYRAVSAAAVVVVFAVSLMFLWLFPAVLTHAENVELAAYIESTLDNGEVSGCYDVLKGETTVGAIVNLYVATDEREGSFDEMRVYIEYSSKSRLVDSRFDDLPAYGLQNEKNISVRATEYNNGEFVTLAAFSDDKIRVCVEIKSGETRRLETYCGVIVMWFDFVSRA